MGQLPKFNTENEDLWKYKKESLCTKVHVACWQCSTKYLGHLPTLVLTHPCNFLFLLYTVCLVWSRYTTKSLTDNWQHISNQFTSIGLYSTANIYDGITLGYFEELFMLQNIGHSKATWATGNMIRVCFRIQRF